MNGTKVKIKTGWKLENSYANLPELFFTRQDPTPVPSPKLIILNNPLATSLGLNIESLESEGEIAVFAGNKIPEGALPLAQAYAGHQYGHFSILGDGRALLLGEQITPLCERVDIQLKGSGRTPYSRRGDGLAALGPMLREYIISEAMYALGIPTTRSLAVVTTGETVIRENLLPGAILTRVAASHIRVGTFQYVSRCGTVEELRALADYTLKRHFSDYNDAENPYLFLLQEVIKRQAILIAKWQLVGFVHGVMNTDNVAISGETIDYGPCAFMDAYDPATVFSSIDREGRYAYGNQPYITVWNLARFAETLLPLLHENHEKAIKMAEDALSNFAELYHNKWMTGMRAKLGIFNEEQQDELLIKDLLNMMHKYSADYTNTFRALTINKLSDMEMFDSESFAGWHKQWETRLGRQNESKESSHQLMKNSNPAIIPRNHRVEEALKAAEKQGDYSVMEKLLDILANPYAYSEEQADYATLTVKSDCPYRTFCGT
ncbi:protein adenylyltransferase SelO family protein [Clostridium sp.]|uniref:protein adenylyltransferase SelO n=1 Tax=Clostridium sp. TaxID=1506 RepID=UPI0028485393|nr:YdiU family protein [Clostridium sp.]MDR3597389.1 YdiU family protein [Clostridium sp.]